MHKISVLIILSCLIFMTGCNNEEDFRLVKPSITLDNESGVYETKVGHQLTIEPIFTDLSDGYVTWSMDNTIIAKGSVLHYTWDTAGTYYITITATNSAGTTSEDVRVEVMELLKPIIEFQEASGSIYVLPDQTYTFKPVVTNAESMEWSLDGSHVGSGSTYTFNMTQKGVYKLTLTARNTDGQTTASITINVVDTLPYRAYFTSPSLRQPSTTRYTFANRPVCLYPMIENFDNAKFIWQCDGQPIECDSRTCMFTPTRPGEYNVTVTLSNQEKHMQTSASVKVVCVEATETQQRRPASASSSQSQTSVLEYVPAPGQFINENMDISTQTDANSWALQQLTNKSTVSLGGCCGYIIVGFDHSIPAGSSDYDFIIGSNAITTSNEPGIVWVMQDVNGNGLPDDEWYELRGSETGQASTLEHYAVTYYKPTTNRQAPRWSDNYGHSGNIPVNSYHQQNSYFPHWIDIESYTIYGTRLGARNTEDPTTGFWENRSYGWGYVDNLGTDNITNNTWPGQGQRNGFKISNAMYSDQTPIKLQYIDFIKVMTGVNAISGAIGEISTEITGFYDCSIHD